MNSLDRSYGFTRSLIFRTLYYIALHLFTYHVDFVQPQFNHANFVQGFIKRHEEFRFNTNYFTFLHCFLMHFSFYIFRLNNPVSFMKTRLFIPARHRVKFHVQFTCPISSQIYLNYFH